MNLGVAFVLSMGILTGCGQGAKIESNELRETKAADLKIDIRVVEENNKDQARVTGVMRTLPGEDGIEFTQGEKLKVTSEDGDGNEQDSANLSLGDPLVNDLINAIFLGLLTDDFFYAAHVDKPLGNQEYHLSYIDSEGTQTTVSFQSVHVEETTSPINNRIYRMGQPVIVEWEAGVQENLFVNVYNGRGSLVQTYSVEDNGTFTVNLDEPFLGAAPLRLVNCEYINHAEGFGAAEISICSYSTPVNIQFN